MSTTPKVSVIIPVYNGMEFIERSIKSLLEQTTKTVEFVTLLIKIIKVKAVAETMLFQRQKANTLLLLIQTIGWIRMH